MPKNKIIDAFVFVICLLFSSWIMFSTISYDHGAIRMKSKLWSDFAAHVPLIRSFSLGDNFPPEYPTFPGEPIRYHYLFYLLVGGLERVGLNLPLAINLPSTLGFALLLWLIYKTTCLFFRSRPAGILAIILFLFNGTLSWLTYFDKYGWSLASLLSIPRLVHFPSFGPWDGHLVSAFWNLNIYTNQRHLGLSFALAILVLQPFLRVLNHRPVSRWWPVILAPVMLIMPLLHQAAFVMIWVVVVALSFYNLKNARRYFPLVLGLAIGSILGILIGPHPGAQNLVFQPGYLAKDTQLVTLATYWFWNLGLYMILIPVLLICLKAPGRIFLLSLLPLFVIANLFRLSPDMINNHKLLNFFMIGVVILASGLIMRVAAKFWWGRLLVPIAIFAITFSGIIDLFPVINDYSLEVADLPKNSTANWIAESTPPKSIFLTTIYLYNPAGLAGRKTFEDYGYFNWSMGYNDQERRRQLATLFSPTLSANSVCAALQDNRINYVLISSGKGDLGSIDPQQSLIARAMVPKYQSSTGDRIYAVKDNCR